MLTDFQCIQCKDNNETAPPFTSFLERNPTIKNLRIDADDLCKISFNTSSIRLDCLSIDLNETNIEPIEFCNQIKSLYGNGYFKTLRLAEEHNIFNPQFSSRLEMFTNELISFNALEVLHACEFSQSICHLTGLKELHIRYLDNSIDLEAIAKNLTKLERLWIQCTVDQFLPFFRYSKTIKMVILDGVWSRADRLNVLNLNKVREMSGLKRKVKIGVSEKVYLTAKWKAQNVNYGVVEFTRRETIFGQFDYNDLHESFLG